MNASAFSTSFSEVNPTQTSVGGDNRKIFKNNESK